MQSRPLATATVATTTTTAITATTNTAGAAAGAFPTFFVLILLSMFGARRSPSRRCRRRFHGPLQKKVFFNRGCKSCRGRARESLVRNNAFQQTERLRTAEVGQAAFPADIQGVRFEGGRGGPRWR